MLHRSDNQSMPTFDQAAGLRRILKRPSVRVLPVLGSANDYWVAALLAEALARRGERVLLIDQGDGAALRVLGIDPRRPLAEVIQGRCEIEEAVVACNSGVYATVAGDLFEGLDAQKLAAADFFGAFAHAPAPSDLVVIRVTRPSAVARYLSAEGEILLVTSPEPEALFSTYTNVKRTCARSHRYRVVVHSSDSAAHGQAVYARMARTAERFLGISPVFAGHVPAGPLEPDGPARSRAGSALETLAAQAVTWRLAAYPAHRHAPQITTIAH